MRDEAHDHVRGRVIYLLALVVLVQTVYPITAGGNLMGTVIYQLLYGSLVVVGIILAHDTRRQTAVLVTLGALYVFSGVLYAFNQSATWALFLGYGTIMPFQLMVALVLLRFVFRARDVTRDVLSAAVALYLLLGAIFVPAYGLLETARPGSFVDGAVPAGAIFPWQHFVYFSYSTLTTLGYGDIQPVTLWARSLTSLEALVGVLYLTIIMARLVGLYATERR